MHSKANLLRIPQSLKNHTFPNFFNFITTSKFSDCCNLQFLTPKITENPSSSPKPAMIHPIVSKLYCSPHEAALLVRRRPKVAGGGGFAVSDGSQRLLFTVEGCGVLGRKEEVVLRDGDGNALLLIRHTGGLIEALTLKRKWKGFSYEYEESTKLVFTLKEPNSCCSSKSPIRIAAGSRIFEVRGDFVEGSCVIVDAAGELIAQIGGKINVDLFYVKIMSGIDQAFVVGVIAVLDYINGGSTRC